MIVEGDDWPQCRRCGRTSVMYCELCKKYSCSLRCERLLQENTNVGSCMDDAVDDGEPMCVGMQMEVLISKNSELARLIKKDMEGAEDITNFRNDVRLAIDPTLKQTKSSTKLKDTLVQKEQGVVIKLGSELISDSSIIRNLLEALQTQKTLAPTTSSAPPIITPELSIRDDMTLSIAKILDVGYRKYKKLADDYQKMLESGARMIEPGIAPKKTTDGEEEEDDTDSMRNIVKNARIAQNICALSLIKGAFGPKIQLDKDPDSVLSETDKLCLSYAAISGQVDYGYQQSNENVIFSPKERVNKVAEEFGHLCSKFKGNVPAKVTIAKYILSIANGNIDSIGKKHRHFVLTGNAGTGKSTMAKHLGKLLMYIGYFPRPDPVEGTLGTDTSAIIARYLGQTAIKTKNFLSTVVGSVCLIDEAYGLVSAKGGGGGESYTDEAVRMILKMCDNIDPSMSIIFAGYIDDMITLLEQNVGLKRRFTNMIMMEVLQKDILIDVIVDDLEEKRVTLSDLAKGALRVAIETLVKNQVFSHWNIEGAHAIASAIANRSIVSQFGKQKTKDKFIATSDDIAEAIYEQIQTKFGGIEIVYSFTQAEQREKSKGGAEPVPLSQKELKRQQEERERRSVCIPVDRLPKVYHVVLKQEELGKVDKYVPEEMKIRDEPLPIPSYNKIVIHTYSNSAITDLSLRLFSSIPILQEDINRANVLLRTGDPDIDGSKMWTYVYTGEELKVPRACYRFGSILNPSIEEKLGGEEEFGGVQYDKALELKISSDMKNPNLVLYAESVLVATDVILAEQSQSLYSRKLKDYTRFYYELYVISVTLFTEGYSELKPKKLRSQISDAIKTVETYSMIEESLYNERYRFLMQIVAFFTEHETFYTTLDLKCASIMQAVNILMRQHFINCKDASYIHGELDKLLPRGKIETEEERREKSPVIKQPEVPMSKTMKAYKKVKYIIEEAIKSQILEVENQKKALSNIGEFTDDELLLLVESAYTKQGKVRTHTKTNFEVIHKAYKTIIEAQRQRKEKEKEKIKV